MYNFSGIVFRLWAVCGILLSVGVVCILLGKPWKNNFRDKKCIIGILAVGLAIVLGGVYLSRIVLPSVSSYEGVLEEINRNDRVAPPLPVTHEYIFWNGEGKKKVFFLDTFSSKTVFPEELVEGESYKVYFDELTKVIVGIQVLP